MLMPIPNTYDPWSFCLLQKSHKTLIASLNPFQIPDSSTQLNFALSKATINDLAFELDRSSAVVTVDH